MSDTSEREHLRYPKDLEEAVAKRTSELTQANEALRAEIAERKRAQDELRKSEEQFEQLFQHAPLGYQALDEDGYFLAVNQAWLDQLGYSRDEVIGHWFGSFLKPEAHAQFKERFQCFKDSGQVHGAEFEMIRKDGSPIIVSIDGRIDTDEQGRFKQTHCILHDITEQKRAEDAAERAHAELSHIFNAAVPLCVVDMDGKVVRVNNTFCSFFGVKGEAIVGGECREMFAGPLCRSAECPIGQILAGAERSEHEVAKKLSDGRRVSCVVTATPCRTGDGELVGIVQSFTDITERKQAEEETRKLAAMVRHSSELVNLATMDGKMIFLNEAGVRMLGIDPEEIEHVNIMDVIPKHLVECVEGDLLPTLMRGDIWDGDLQYRNLKTGNVTDVHARTFTVKDPDTKEPQFLANVSTDITDRKRAEQERRELEAQLRQSQKMEAIGQLAGGVAHDFNNLLTAILGNAELLLDTLKQESLAASADVAIEGLNLIKRAAENAADLTRRLLMFSRRQPSHTTLVDLSRVLASMEQMLRHVIREDIVLDIRIAPEIGTVRMGGGQAEQIVINLVLNARDAMPEGGTATVECANVTLDESHIAVHPRATPGPHVMIAVSDTGVGMSAETLSHLFEPFYTTKPVGKGTGLGLATVYGIVRQVGGHLAVESELGKGSTFRAYLPVVVEPEPEVGVADAAAPTHGNEVILVCEDQEIVRKVTTQVLQTGGYKVLEAASGRQALSIAEEYGEPIDLLVTDVIMPRMNGGQLAQALSTRYPHMATLFVSGYTADIVEGLGVQDSEANFLQKPFRPPALLNRVRQVLAERRSALAGTGDTAADPARVGVPSAPPREVRP